MVRWGWEVHRQAKLKPSQHGGIKGQPRSGDEHPCIGRSPALGLRINLFVDITAPNTCRAPGSRWGQSGWGADEPSLLPIISEEATMGGF